MKSLYCGSSCSTADLLLLVRVLKAATPSALIEIWMSTTASFGIILIVLIEATPSNDPKHGALPSETPGARFGFSVQTQRNPQLRAQAAGPLYDANRLFRLIRFLPPLI